MKCLIVEDESLAAIRLVRLMSEVAPHIECFVAMNGYDGLLQARQRLPDLVFLDVRMPGMDGLELASELQNLPIPPALIFCSAYEAHALEAINRQASAYLLKPVSRMDLSCAIKVGCRANKMQLNTLKNIRSKREYIRSVSHRGIETMQFDLIRCFIAEEKYVLACGKTTEFLITDSLKSLEVKFQDRLLRVHRKALVATNYVSALSRASNGWEVVLEGTDIRPPVSRRHLVKVRNHLSDR